MKRLRNAQGGFTLMELMVVIVIVAILAAVAVPLYINYVNDARLTEAKGAIGAIITAEQTFYQKSGGEGTPTYTDLATLKTNNQLDITEAEVKWTFTTPTEDAAGFSVHAELKTDATQNVTYTYTRVAGGSFDK